MILPIQTGLRNNCRAMWTLATLFAAGCGTVPATDPPFATEADVTATVINVTPFEVSVLLSGIRDNNVDTVERRADTLDTAEVTFVCIDELVVGDPLAPETAGVLIDPDGQAERIGIVPRL